MHVLEADGDRVDAQLLGDEVHGVQAILNFVDFSVLRHSAGWRDCRRQVERRDACKAKQNYFAAEKPNSVLNK